MCTTDLIREIVAVTLLLATLATITASPFIAWHLYCAVARLASNWPL